MTSLEAPYPRLFEPGTIGRLSLRNRIVQCPMGTGFAEDGRVSGGDVPERALVLDDGGGFWQGISAAEYLAERGADVELVTPARGVGLAIPEESVGNVHRRLRSSGVRFRALSRVDSVDGTTVRLVDVVSGEASETSADIVVVVPSLRVEDGLVDEVAGTVPALVSIGDCAAPRRLNHAVLEANLAVRRFHEERLGSTSLVLF